MYFLHCELNTFPPLKAFVLPLAYPVWAIHQSGRKRMKASRLKLRKLFANLLVNGRATKEVISNSVRVHAVVL